MKSAAFRLPPLLALLPFLPALTASAQFIGPSTTTDPYLIPSSANIRTTSILTVGDSVNSKANGSPYRMVGIPDGLGAFDNGDGTLTVLMNHELGTTAGIARDHGGTGAFVSKWTIDSKTFQVRSGADLIQEVQLWNGSDWQSAANSLFGRFCSADLPAPTAFYNPSTGLGTTERIFMNGEEAGSEGRAFGTVVSSGTAYELPALGKFSWENSVANPGSGNVTLVAGMDDSTPGQVYFYQGQKQATGNPIERAGLSDGNLWGLKVPNVSQESRSGGLDGSPEVRESFAVEFFNQGNVTGMTGAQVQAGSVSGGVTEFLRPEDGAWNPLKPDQFFFVTTDRFDTTKTGTGSQQGRSRLWQLDISDLSDLSKGGRLSMLLDGTESQQMLDNLTVTENGMILLQEDPGGQDYLSRVWSYDLDDGSLEEIAAHDPDFFQPGAAVFLTRDEESSGILDITGLLNRPDGNRYYLADVQAHYSLGGELVEGGQLLVLTEVPEASTWIGGGLIAAAAGATWIRRRNSWGLFAPAGFAVAAMSVLSRRVDAIRPTPERSGDGLKAFGIGGPVVRVER
ncbi:MAG: hypothetical protein IT581_04905 [Verrucomicrobiales bacterium]|nr:hypothetical protein [Verrucomicrobiales bacterium]